jgi:DNA-binding response OmpR family regulator
MSRPAALEREEISLDAFGVLRRGGTWTALPTMERQVLALLLYNLDQVVPTSEFYELVWPDREPSHTRRPLNVLVHRLRKRIQPLGLSISTIRGQGYLLHRSRP